MNVTRMGGGIVRALEDESSRLGWKRRCIAKRASLGLTGLAQCSAPGAVANHQHSLNGTIETPRWKFNAQTAAAGQILQRDLRIAVEQNVSQKRAIVHEHIGNQGVPPILTVVVPGAHRKFRPAPWQ